MPDATAAPSPKVTRVPHWSASLAVLAALGLYLILPGELTLGPRLLVPVVEVALVVILALVRAYTTAREESEVRVLVIFVVAVLNLANMVAVAILVDDLLYGSVIRGRPLLYGAVSVWLTNIIVYALWFWQLDQGGPVTRARGMGRPPDFQFPQMVTAQPPTVSWEPRFVDYLYVSLTNALAFSPTDTMPLSRAAKALMGAESLISVITVAIVAGRAVNILR